MATKAFDTYTEVSQAKGSDVLLIHDGAGVKKIQKKNFMSEIEILMALTNGTYEGRDLTVVFADEITNYSDEWAWIQARLDAGELSDLFPFDYIPVTALGENHIAQIAGIDTYYNTGDAGYEVKHHIDWITKDCLGTTVQWNTTNVNNGNATNSSPFLVSNVHSWLVNTVYPTLDAKLKAVIKDKRILAHYRYQSGSTLTDDNSWGFQYFDKLWLPLEIEIFDCPVFSSKPYGFGQAVQYEIFRNSYRARIKGAGPGGARASWWEASAHSGYSAHACFVDGGGYANSYSASAAFYAPLCFRTMAA